MDNDDKVEISQPSQPVHEDMPGVSGYRGGTIVGTSDAIRYSTVLARVSDMVNASVDKFTIIRQIMQEAAGLFGAERAMVLLYESGGS
jgi:hypothetical protein